MLRLAVLAVAVTWLCSGCAPSTRDMASFLKVHEHAATGTERRVRPPDTVVISATLAEEVDGTTARVRDDGKITLRLLGDVRVAGLTAKEIAAKIERQLSRYYVGAKVSVQVSGQRAFYVFGQVSNPGPRRFTGHDTVFDVIAPSVGSFLTQTDRVKILRPAQKPGEEPREFTVNVDKMVYAGDMSQNVLLAEGDIVYLPPTAVAWMAMKVNEFLYPVGPVIRLASTAQVPDAIGDAAEPDDDDDGDNVVRYRYDY